jgi:hypothetical protein
MEMLAVLAMAVGQRMEMLLVLTQSLAGLACMLLLEGRRRDKASF